MKRSPEILFLVPYPLDEAPSQRFRFEQYFQTLSEAGYRYSVQSFLPSYNWRAFYGPGNGIKKLGALIFGFGKRIFAVLKTLGFDFVFIHREVTPIGPPIFEWIISKILRKKIIYDFDDAIWLTDKTNERWLEKSIRWRGKVKWICKWSYKVSCGNDYLSNYARQFNGNVVLNPTTIDTDKYSGQLIQSAKKNTEKVIIGWTGSHSTLKYLNGIEEVLQRLEKTFPEVEFWVIADKLPKLNLPKLQFRPWARETEVQDLTNFDIGLMPLPNDVWTKGKCGFKALQYMAIGIPAVVSPVGVNTKIIKHGENGYLAADYEWEELISSLIKNKSLRKELGKGGITTVENSFSVNSNKKNFIMLFS